MVCLRKRSLLVDWEAGELTVGTGRLALHASILDHGEQGRRWKWRRSGHHSTSRLLLHRHGGDRVEAGGQLVLLHRAHKGDHGRELDRVLGVGTSSDKRRFFLEGAR